MTKKQSAWSEDETVFPRGHGSTSQLTDTSNPRLCLYPGGKPRPPARQSRTLARRTKRVSGTSQLRTRTTPRSRPGTHYPGYTPRGTVRKPLCVSPASAVCLRAQARPQIRRCDADTPCAAVLHGKKKIVYWRERRGARIHDAGAHMAGEVGSFCHLHASLQRLLYELYGLYGTSKKNDTPLLQVCDSQSRPCLCRTASHRCGGSLTVSDDLHGPHDPQNSRSRAQYATLCQTDRTSKCHLPTPKTPRSQFLGRR